MSLSVSNISPNTGVSFISFQEVISLQKEANLGNPEAQRELGIRYKNGEGVKLSYQEAVKWLAKSADFYRDKGNFQKAFEIYEIEHNIWKDIHENKDSGLATSLNNLGKCLCYLGKFQEALQKHQSALKISQMISPENEFIAASLDNIGLTLKKLGDFESALDRHLAALDVKKKIYGSQSNHIEIAKTLGNLALALVDIRRFEEAWQYIQEAWKMKNVIYDVELHSEKAITLGDMSFISAKLGRLKDASKYSQKALEMNQKLYGLENHPELVRSLSDVANILTEEGRFKEALKFYQEALKMEREIYGLEILHPNVAVTLSKMAFVYRELGSFDEALKHALNSLKMQRSIFGSEPHLEIAHTLWTVGRVYRQLGCFDEALKYYQESLEMIKKFFGLKPNLETASILNSMGFLYGELGRFEEERLCFQESLEIQRKIFGSKPHHEISSTLNNMGLVYRELGRFNKASEYYQEALEMARKIFGLDPNPYVSDTLNNLGVVLRDLAQLDESLKYLQEALQMDKAIYKSADHHYSAITLTNIGHTLKELGRFEEAYEYYERALHVYERPASTENCKEYGQGAVGATIGAMNTDAPYNPLIKTTETLKYLTPNASLTDSNLEISNERSSSSNIHYKQGRSLSGKCECLGALGKFKIALDIQKDVLKIEVGFFGKNHLHIGNSYRYIGVCHYSLGEYSLAMDNYQKALPIYISVYGSTHPEIATLLSYIANCFAAQQKIKEALEKQEEALAIRQEFYGKDHPLVAMSLSNLGSYYFAQGNFEQALKKYKECLSIRQIAFDRKHPDVTFTLTCIDICIKALRKELTEEQDIEEGILSKEHFQELLDYSICYLQDNNNKLALEKNPSGFIRMRLPIPKNFFIANRIENIRLHYWPPEFKIDTVEALHNHPRYFESMILQGGYTHAIYKKGHANSLATPFRVHRIVKSPNDKQKNVDERNIFSLGIDNLESLGEKQVQKDSIFVFPKNIIHQVINYEPNTLTINAVFKDPQDLTYFDVYMAKDHHEDPQREREFLTINESTQIMSKIKMALNQWKTKGTI